MASGREWLITSITLNGYGVAFYILIINCYKVMSLSFSPSGRMLLATSDDITASIWNVPSGTTWPSTPHVTLIEHSHQVNGGAFLGDESHAITGSADESLNIWRTSDGEQTVNYECDKSVRHLCISILLTIFFLFRHGHYHIMLHLESLPLVLVRVMLKYGKQRHVIRVVFLPLLNRMLASVLD